MRLLLLASFVAGALGHGKLLCPLPRQYRNTKPIGWTNWMGIVVPGSLEYSPGIGNAANLNAGIGGGTGGQHGSQPGEHGICGDIGSRKGFNDPDVYGAEPARGTYVEGGKMQVRAQITAWHKCARRESNGARAAAAPALPTALRRPR